jgi:hypothetical protein
MGNFVNSYGHNEKDFIEDLWDNIERYNNQF